MHNGQNSINTNDKDIELADIGSPDGGSIKTAGSSTPPDSPSKTSRQDDPKTWKEKASYWAANLTSQGQGAIWSMVMTSASAVANFTLGTYASAPLSLLASTSISFLNAAQGLKLYFVSDYIKNTGIPKLADLDKGDIIWLRKYIKLKESSLTADEKTKLKQLYFKATKLTVDSEQTIKANHTKEWIDLGLSIVYTMQLALFIAYKYSDNDDQKQTDDDLAAFNIAMASVNMTSYLWGLWRTASSDNIKTDINRIGSQISILRELYGEIDESVLPPVIQADVPLADATLSSGEIIVESPIVAPVDINVLHDEAQADFTKQLRRARQESLTATGGSFRKKDEYGIVFTKPTTPPPAKPNSSSATQRTSRPYDQVLPPTTPVPLRPANVDSNNSTALELK